MTARPTRSAPSAKWMFGGDFGDDGEVDSACEDVVDECPHQRTALEMMSRHPVRSLREMLSSVGPSSWGPEISTRA